MVVLEQTSRILQVQGRIISWIHAKLYLHRAERTGPAFTAALLRSAAPGVSSQGHLEVVRRLCNDGAEKIQAMTDDLIPLHVASRLGHLEAVRLL